MLMDDMQGEFRSGPFDPKQWKKGTPVAAKYSVRLFIINSQFILLTILLRIMTYSRVPCWSFLDRKHQLISVFSWTKLNL